MAFDLGQFRAAQMSHREDDVHMPGLSDFAGAPVTFRVRGLTHHEVARAREMADKAAGLVEALRTLATAANGKDQGEGLARYFGMTPDTPADTARRIHFLVCGCVEPAGFAHDDAVRLAEHFVADFQAATDRIMELSALGSVPGKPPASTASQT